TSEGVRVVYVPRGTRAERTIEVAQVLDCTGPAMDAVARSPLLGGLVQAGGGAPPPLRPRPVGDRPRALLNGRGQTARRLFALGPLLRGQRWETIAIPEIREQAGAVAEALLRR